jgi:hypothetical protein
LPHEIGEAKPVLNADGIAGFGIGVHREDSSQDRIENFLRGDARHRRMAAIGADEGHLAADIVVVNRAAQIELEVNALGLDGVHRKVQNADVIEARGGKSATISV